MQVLLVTAGVPADALQSRYAESDECTAALQETAQLVASKADWSLIYDSHVLARNTVPVASAAFYEVSCLLLACLRC